MSIAEMHTMQSKCLRSWICFLNDKKDSNVKNQTASYKVKQLC